MRRVLGLSLVPLALLAATALAHPEHRVQSGDTLWDIARRHNTTVAALKRANDLDSDVIHPGQVLRIPSSGGRRGISDIISPGNSDGDDGGSSTANARRTVTADVLNVRRGPGTNTATIGRLERGEQVEVVEERGDWRRLAGGGWVHGAYLEGSGVAAPTPPGRRQTVTASTLNVRSRPSTSAPVVGRLNRGDRVEVTGQSGAWRRIDQGWVHGNYLTSGTVSEVSRAGFVQLPDSGPGFYGYYAASKRWGTPRLVEGLKRVCRRFAQRHPNGPRIGFGDISLRNGGDIAGHASHERGIDVDISPLRNDGREARRGGLGKLRWQDAAYSRRLTQELIDLIRQELPVVHIFFNDPHTRGTSPWPNHDNHLHVRIRR